MTPQHQGTRASANGIRPSPNKTSTAEGFHSAQYRFRSIPRPRPASQPLWEQPPGAWVPLASGKGEKSRESTQPTSVRPIVPALTFEQLDWKQPGPTEKNIPTADAQAAAQIEPDLEPAQNLEDSSGENISIMCVRCNKTFASRNAISAHLGTSGHDKEDEGDSTTAHSSTSHGDLDVENLPLHRVPRIEAKDEERLTPLHSAAAYGHLEEVRLLLNQGARIELQDASNKTPLHCAVERGHLEVVRLLLERGARTNAKNFHKENSLHLAAQRGYVEVANLLLLFDPGA